MSNSILSDEKLKRQFQQDLEAAKSKIKKPNILILGNTGVGKSSLINVIFGRKLAEVSHVKPETRGFHKYSTQDCSVNIIDSEGYELENEQYFKKSLEDFIVSNFTNLENQIHICWYCISISSGRVLPFDIANLKYLLSKKIPTALVFTQCDNDDPEGSVAKTLGNVFYREFNDKIRCFQTSNDPEINKELDIASLIQWSADNISDENLRMGFIAAQMISLKEKDEAAMTRVKWYSAGAAGIGAVPIPCSDAVLLTVLQLRMAADIYSIYGLDNSISRVLSSVIQERIVSMLGKMIVGNILKWIPFIGSAIGGAINAAVAGSITLAMGKAISALCHKAFKDSLEGKDAMLEYIFTPENLNKMFDAFYKKD